MKDPVVSVVVPSLNRAHFLGPTIDSILQQDYSHIECLVIDGGSTDGTIELLKGYGDRIKWLSEPDSGQADAINKGWQMSAGDILAWLNADDMWSVPHAVSWVVEYLQAHPAVDVVYGDCGMIDAEGNLIGMAYLHQWDLEYAIEYCDHCIPQPAAFIRRRILEQTGWLDTNLIFMDRDLWYRIGLVGAIAYQPTLFGYARKGQSYWYSRGQVAAENCVQVIQKFYSLPGVPGRIQAKKHRAISNSYFRAINYASMTDCHWSVICGYTLRAILADPTNTINALRRFKRYLASHAAKKNKWLYIGMRSVRLLRQMVWEIKREVKKSNAINLLGDRDVEWSWMAAHLPSGPGQALDFGSGASYLALIAAQRDFDVTAVDMGPVQWPYTHPRLRFIQGDIRTLPLPAGQFDLIINCSTVEHVGLAGRYGVIESQPDGDLEAMAHLWKLLKPGGVMLLTIPVGQDMVFAPLHRIYGSQRLPCLLAGYRAEEEAFWVKDDQNRWVLSDRETALNFKVAASSWNPLENVYALGCFVLKKQDSFIPNRSRNRYGA